MFLDVSCIKDDVTVTSWELDVFFDVNYTKDDFTVTS